MIVLIFALGFGFGAMAQETPPKTKAEKKAAAKGGKTQAKARQKPTPEQIRKFNELQKKQQ